LSSAAESSTLTYITLLSAFLSALITKDLILSAANKTSAASPAPVLTDALISA